MIILSVLFGLGAALGFGVGDFFGAKAAKKVGALKTAFLVELYGFILLSSIIWFLGFPANIPTWTIALSVATGLIFALAFWAFFKALDIGPVAVTNPIANSYALISILVGVVFLSERLNPQQWVAIAIILVGIFLGSAEFENLKVKFKNKTGILLALIAMFTWGLNFPIIDIIIEQIGWATTLLLNFAFSAFWLGIFNYKMFKKETKKLSFDKNVILITMLQFLGVVAMFMGLEKGLVSVVTPVASISPLITALLAIFLLKERLYKIQYFGAGFIILGLILLAI